MTVKLTISSRTNIEGLPREIVSLVRQRLSFPNPEYLEREKRGLWLAETHKELCFLSRHGDSFSVPRGFSRQLVMILRANGVAYQIEDRRRVLPAVDFTFAGTLRDYQQEAVDAILRRDFATLSAPTGSGKTVVGLAIIAERKQPALIVCHTKELLNQWVDRIESFLGIPANEVGVIGAGKKKLGAKVNVALVQSLVKCAGEVAPHIGMLVVDECHRAPSKTFLDVVTAFDCRYQLGLSATPFRRDGLSRLIYWFIGDVAHKIEREGLIENGAILPAEVTWRETNFTTTVDPSERYSTMLSELCEDEARNELIVADVARELSTTGTVLVLTDRKNHCQTLQDMLARRGIEAEVLTGDLPAKPRQAVVEKLATGQIRVVVATGQLIGEGFDCKGLSTLVLATPIRFYGRVIQSLGRVLRPAPGKTKARVIDFLDPIGVLQASARARDRAYRAGG